MIRGVFTRGILRTNRVSIASPGLPEEALET